LLIINKRYEYDSLSCPTHIWHNLMMQNWRIKLNILKMLLLYRNRRIIIRTKRWATQTTIKTCSFTPYKPVIKVFINQTPKKSKQRSKRFISPIVKQIHPNNKSNYYGNSSNYAIIIPLDNAILQKYWTCPKNMVQYFYNYKDFYQSPP